MSARGLVAPYRPGTVGGIALGTALIAIGISARLWTGAVGAFDLRDVIFACRNALPALALPVGWLAVWAASVHTSDSAIIGAAPGRPRNQIVLRQAGVLAAATTLGWLAGWAVPGGIAFATQYWTPVDLLGLAVLAVAAGSLAPIGLAVAMLCDVRPGALVTPLVLMLVLVLPAFFVNDVLLKPTPFSTQALSYVWSLAIPQSGTTLAWTTELLRLAFYLLVTFAAAKAAVGWAEFRATRNRAALASTAWLTLPVAVSVVVAWTVPPLAVLDPNDQVNCRADAGYTLCLFQLDEPNRSEFEIALAPVMALLPPEALAKVTFSQDWATAEAMGAIGIDRLGSGRHAWLDGMNSIVWSLFKPYPDPALRCEGRPEEAIYETSALETTITWQVGRRAAAATIDDPASSEQFSLIVDSNSGHGSEVADQWLDGLSDDDFRDWYQQNRPRLVDCTLTEQDFPR